MNRLTIIVFVFGLFTSCMQSQTWVPGNPNAKIHKGNFKKSQHYKQKKHIDGIDHAN